MAGITVVGVIAVDCVAHIPHFPQTGGHVSGTSLEIFPGAPGGNVAAGLARWNVPTRFVGRTGGDFFGHMLRQALDREGVEQVPELETPSLSTTVVMVIVDQNGLGEPTSFSFRESCADVELDAADVARADVARGAKAVFVDGILLMTEKNAKAALKAAETARAKGLPVFFDPNLRIPEPVVPPEQRSRLDQILHLADIILLNQHEALAIAGTDDPAHVTAYFAGRGAQAVALKRGSDGCYLGTPAQGLSFPGFKVPVADTSGAGDAFDAGFIAAWHEGRTLEEAAQVANAAGALAVTKKGAWLALPRRADVLQFLTSQVSI
jgi:ribokinase